MGNSAHTSGKLLSLSLTMPQQNDIPGYVRIDYRRENGELGLNVPVSRAEYKKLLKEFHNG
jgi:hypothetical protein